MWERLEGREIRRRRASSARTAARRGISAPEVGDRPRPDLPEGADLLPQIRTRYGFRVPAVIVSPYARPDGPRRAVVART